MQCFKISYIKKANVMKISKPDMVQIKQINLAAMIVRSIIAILPEMAHPFLINKSTYNSVRHRGMSKISHYVCICG